MSDSAAGDRGGRGEREREGGEGEREGERN